MMVIPKNLFGAELIAFLRANKDELIKQKCAFPVKSEPNSYPYTVSEQKTTAIKADVTVEVVQPGQKNVSVVGNACNYIDSQMDALIPDNWKKTIKESGPAGKDRIYHLKDHKQNMDGVVGKPSSIYSKDISLADLGLPYAGSTQCLVMDSLVKENLDKKVFEMYVSNMVKQHSIGLQYVKLELCINDVNSPVEFVAWNKYFMAIINKDVADRYGYFWAVTEIKLLEISAVLWGSNELTPTIEDDPEEKTVVEIPSECPECKEDVDFIALDKSNKGAIHCPGCGTKISKTKEPSKDTHIEEPPSGTQGLIDYIKGKQFFNN